MLFLKNEKLSLEPKRREKYNRIFPFSLYRELTESHCRFQILQPCEHTGYQMLNIASISFSGMCLFQPMKTELYAFLEFMATESENEKMTVSTSVSID